MKTLEGSLREVMRLGDWKLRMRKNKGVVTT